MQLKVITARFGRKRQPVQFENAEAVLELSFAVEEDGSIGDISIEHIGMAEKLLGTVKTLVLRELNIVPADGNASVALAAKEAAQTGETTPAKVTKPRKAKDKDDAPPAQTASAAAAASANETRLISTGNERIDPAQVEVGSASVAQAQPATANVPDIPAGGAPIQAATAPAGSPTGPTAEELTKWVGDLVKAGKLDSATAKATSRKYGAEKIAQIDASKLSAYKADIEEAVKRFAAASEI